MAVRKQTIDFPLAVGMDTKTDDKQTTQLRLVENSYVKKTGELRKRNGYTDETKTSLNAFDTSTAALSITKGYGLYNYNDAAVIIAKDREDLDYQLNSGRGIFIKSKASDKWVRLGSEWSVAHTSDKVSASSSTTDTPNISVGGGYDFISYESGTQTKYNLIDSETGALVHEGLGIYPSSTSPKSVFLIDNDEFNLSSISGGTVGTFFATSMGAATINYLSLKLDDLFNVVDKGSLDTLDTEKLSDLIQVDGYSGQEALIVHKNATNDIEVNKYMFDTTQLGSTLNLVADPINSLSVQKISSHRANTHRAVSWSNSALGPNSSGTWCVGGDDGYISKSQNDGIDWASVISGHPLGVATDFSDVYGMASQNLASGVWMQVGLSGSVKTSLSNGVSWNVQTSGSSESLYGVDGYVTEGFGSSRWIIVGTNGEILLVDDGVPTAAFNNFTFSPITSGTANTLRDVVYNDYSGPMNPPVNKWTVCGDSGTLLGSPNGTVWTTLTSGTSELLHSVATNGDDYVAVGENGIVLTSLNNRVSVNGITWAITTAFTANDLHAVINANGTWIAIGANGEIWTTITPSGTWTQQTSGVTKTLYGINKDDLNNVVICGEDGVILTSSNYIKWINRENKLSRLFIYYQDTSTSNLDVFILEAGGAVKLKGPVTVSDSTSITTHTLSNITASDEHKLADYNESLSYPIGQASHHRIWCERSNADSYVYSLYTLVADFNGDFTELNNSDVMQHVGLASKAWQEDGSSWVVAARDSTLQSTYFLVSSALTAGPSADLIIASHMQHGRSGPHRIGLSNVIKSSTNNYVWTGLNQDRLLSDSDVSYSVVKNSYNFNPNPMPSNTAGLGLEIGGGKIINFDKRSQELGFLIYPENISASAASSTGGSMDDGDRFYVVVYEWIDRLGQVYRSAPSESIAVNFAHGTSTQKTTITCPYLAQTDWDNRVLNSIVLYRTIDGGSVFYRTDSSINLISSDTATIGNGESDTDIQNNEILYTSGGVLANDPPPGSSIMVTRRNRIFLSPMDDPNTIWYTKPKANGVGWEFSEALQVRIDEGGKVTGLGIIDDAIFVFKERDIFYFSGEGPNSLGVGAFNNTLTVATDVGCTDSKSIVTTNTGIFFRSHKGIYLLDRSLKVSYIGAPVEEYNRHNILSAILVDDLNQVRFTLDSGQPTLVYDYFHKLWSIYTNAIPIDATLIDGKYSYITTDGLVRIEDDSFTDGNFVIPQKIETGWIKVSGLQGFQRARRFSLLGELKSNCTITVEVYTDYDDFNIVQTITFLTSNTTSNDPLQFRARLKQQKCQAVKFIIKDSSQENTREGIRLSGIALEIGVKSGINKQPDSKTL